jgi:polysaccharide biosynthesis protein PslJ
MRFSTMRGNRLRVAALVAVAALVVLAASVILPRFVTQLGFIVVPLFLVAVAALATLFVVPVEVVPAVALSIFALVPPRILPQDGPLNALPLTTIVLVVWAVRRIVLGQGNGPQWAAGPRSAEPFKTAAVVFGLLFFVWAAFSILRSPDSQTSLGWLISFTAGALLPLAVGTARREAELIQRAWLVLGGWLGAYAVLEAVLRTNLLWGTVYNLIGLPNAQHWAVYRAGASFGHPLLAALFFAVALALAVGSWLTTRSRWTLAAAIFSGLGLAVTVSRGAMLAGAVAAAFAYFAALLIRGEKRWSRFAYAAGLAVVGVVGIIQFDAFSARDTSAEGELSTGARDLAWWVALQAGHLTGWIGSGTGTSGITGRLFTDVVIENSLLQLLIGVGIPGLLLFALLLGSAFFHALSNRAVGAAAGLLAFAICISSFNALDGVRSMHLLLGCLLILTLNPSAPVGFVPADAAAGSRATTGVPAARLERAEAPGAVAEKRT